MIKNTINLIDCFCRATCRNCISTCCGGYCRTIKTINTSATNVPTPTPSPASRLPGNVPRWRSGRARSDARCPLPLPAGALITSIHTFQHNYCVSCLPHPANDFFSFARSFTWSHSSLRFGLGPGERPRKGFAAAHTIKAIVNNT